MPKKYAKSLFLEFCQILLLCPNAKFELKGELETESVSGPRKENLKRKAPPENSGKNCSSWNLDASDFEGVDFV